MEKTKYFWGLGAGFVVEAEFDLGLKEEKGISGKRGILAWGNNQDVELEMNRYLEIMLIPHWKFYSLKSGFKH